MNEHVARPGVRLLHRQRHFHLVIVGAFVTVAAAGLVVVWLFVQPSKHASALPTAGSGPAIVSQAELEKLASKVAHPVYWAGPKSGFSYEVTVTSGGRFYVRYLPGGVKAGDPRANFLVVGTYTASGSYADLKHASHQAGSVSVGIDKGGISVFAAGRPASVYFSYPGADYQVEVYAPSGVTARGLVLGDKITPIPAP